MAATDPRSFDVTAAQLAGGISQQPPHLRFPGQFEDATNVDFRLEDGAARRNGSIFVKRVTGLTTLTNRDFRLHPIKRDETEQYIVIYGRDDTGVVLKIANVTAGTAYADILCTVTIASAAATYLALNSPTSDQLRLKTIGDTTYIVNTTVAAGTVNTDPFTVTSEWTTYERMRSHTPAALTYHRTTSDSPGFPAGYWLYDPSPDISGNVTFATHRFGTITNGAGYANPAGTWDASGKYGFRIRFKRRTITSSTGWTWNQAARTLTKAASSAFDDYIWRNNDDVNITNGGTAPITTGWAKVKSRVSADAIELEQDLGANSTNVQINAIGDEYEVIYPYDTTTLTDMYQVALKLQNLLRDAGADDALIEWVSLGADTGYFVVTCPYRASQRSVYSTSAPSAGSGATDLTTGANFPFDFAAATAAATAGTGAGSPFLDVEERWTRVAAPNSEDGALDPTKMPVAMVRTTVGSAGVPAVFNVDPITWTPRILGNSDNNPSPEMFQHAYKINDVFFHENRLAFLAGPTVLFSQAGDIYNFYLQDPTNLVDSDPIDLQLSSDRVSTGDYAVPLRDTYVIFTKAGEQFELTNPQAWSPTTAGVRLTSANQTIAVRPRAIGSSIYFLAKGGYAQLYGYPYNAQGGVAGVDDAINLSAHANKLMPDTMKTIAVHENSGRVFCTTAFDPRVWVYRTMTRDTNRVQSSWTKWTFDGTLHDICVMDDDLWVMAFRGSQFALERVPITEQEAEGYAYVVYLDRRVKLTGVHSAGTTTWTLPDGLSDTSITAIVLGPAFGTASGTVLTATTAVGTTVTKTGNYSAGEATLGRLYSTTMKPTRPFAHWNQQGQSAPNLETGIIRRKLVITHQQSGEYMVRTMPANRATVSQSFAPTAAIEDGVFVAWPLGDVEFNTVEIVCSTAKPLIISGLQHVCDIALKLRR